jgi:WD40 repeat protein
MNQSKWLLLIGGLFSLMTIQLSAQEEPTADLSFPLRKQAVGFEKYQSSPYYYSGKKLYNVRGGLVGTGRYPIAQIAFQPDGASCAILSQTQDHAQVDLFNFWNTKDKLATLPVKESTACAYSGSTNRIAVADVSNRIYLFDSETFKAKDTLISGQPVTTLLFNNNGQQMIACAGDELSVWDLPSRSIRTVLQAPDSVRHLSFTADDSQLAILTRDGSLHTYDMTTFLPLHALDALGLARDCDFHPEGKYIGVVTGDTRIMIANLMNSEEREYIDDEEGGITTLRFVKDDAGLVYLIYNTEKAIHYKLMSTLSHNYTKLLSDELNERMSEWEKQMPGETLEDYNLRVNEETRAAQVQLYSDEIATRMAENLVSKSEVTLGYYNPESNILTVDFNTMPTIYLSVPKEELHDFMNPGDLEFSNVIYGLTTHDQFEMTYADIFNRASGKNYTYDNRSHQPMDYLASDDKFIPFDIAQQSGMEEMMLEELKEQTVQTAKQKKTISDHTQITVNADVVTVPDAQGRKQLNYQVGFTYTVDQEFSKQEDFSAGKYHVEDSGAAQSMLEIIQSAFKGEFASYIKSDKWVIIRITGSADALPIRSAIAYNGEYGQFVHAPVYVGNDLQHLTVTSESGITENEQLAFLRSTGVEREIALRLPELKNMDVTYQKAIVLASETGGAYRRIRVEFTFIDAF